VDGGSARDLRAEDHSVDEDAQLTGLLPTARNPDARARSFRTVFLRPGWRGRGEGEQNPRLRGGGEPRGRDVDGGSARDLRAEDHLVDEDAQLTGLLPTAHNPDARARSFRTVFLRPGGRGREEGTARWQIAAVIRAVDRYRRWL
jgi:hypothetical protein